MTSLSVAELLGVQTPRVSLVPPAVTNEADDAVFLASSYGLVPDPWQEHVLRGWLGMTARKKWAAPRCGLAVPRQNGKNGVLEIRELYGLVVRGEKFLHTAHEVKTARKAFQRLLSFFDNPRQFPELADLVLEIRRTNGQEAIVLRNGGSVEFIARSRGSGRGFTVDVLVMDEAQELDEDANAALQPTISAAPSGNPQKILTGTPPAPSMRGGVFLQMRTAGVEGVDARLCWDEWSCLPDCDLDDPRQWAFSNPALGDRLQVEVAADERADMDDERFARERCGVWFENAALAGVIDMRRWAALEDAAVPEIPAVGAFGIDVSTDRDAAIGMAGRRADGAMHIECIQAGRGTDWIVGRCVALNTAHGPASFAVDTLGPGASLIPELKAAGLTVLEMATQDVARAYGLLFDAITQSTLRHGPQPELSAAAAGAKTRPCGDGGSALGRKASGTNISPLVAAEFALWAALTVTEDMSPINNVW